MSQNLAEPYERSSGIVKTESDLSNYLTKVHLKGAAGIDISTLASKTDLASLKAKVVNLNDLNSRLFLII